MRGKYLSWILVFILSISLSSAINITSPIDNSNIVRNLNLTLGNFTNLENQYFNISLKNSSGSGFSKTYWYEPNISVTYGGGGGYLNRVGRTEDGVTYSDLNIYINYINLSMRSCYSVNSNVSIVYTDDTYISQVVGWNGGAGCDTGYATMNNTNPNKLIKKITTTNFLINYMNIYMNNMTYINENLIDKNLSIGQKELNLNKINNITVITARYLSGCTDSANLSNCINLGYAEELIRSGTDFKNSSLIVNLTNNALLNVSVFSQSTSSPISFTSNLSGNIQTAYASVLYDVINGNTYNLTINSTNYNTNTSTYTINSFGTTYLTRYLSAYNSINLTIKDESTGNLILSAPNTSLSIVSDSGLVTYTNVNGSKVLSGLTTDYYTLTFDKSGYNSRQYYLSVPDGSYQFLTVYLNNGSAILFNIMNNGGSTLSGATLFVYTNVNGSNVLVESSVSDITGKIQVSLESSKYYSFLVSKSGYTNYTFFLNPVLFTSYDIKLSTSSSASIYPTATFSYTPTSFFRFQNVNMALTFISPYNYLSTYYYNISYPGGSRAGSGSNIHGQVFNELFNLNSAGLDDNIVLYYNYSLTNGAFYSDTVLLPIIYTSSNRTWVGMGNQINSSTGQDGVTGYYIGERVLIVTFISIVMFGVGWLIGGAMSGLVFAIIPILFFTNVGFVPKELYYLTFVFFIVYIISRGADS